MSSTSENKQIAKEILLKMIDKDDLMRDEFPEADTTVDVICQAYGKILATVNEN